MSMKDEEYYPFTVECQLSCIACGCELKDSLQVDLLSDDYESELIEAVEQYLDDWDNYEPIYDSISECILSAASDGFSEEGILDPDQIGEQIYLAVEKICSTPDNRCVLDTVIEDKHIVVELSLVDWLQKMISDRETTESFYCDVGRHVENHLKSFTDEGVWNYGLKTPDQILIEPNNWPEPIGIGENAKWVLGNNELIPVLWFGREGSVPMKRWSISSDTQMEDYRFWFENDSCDVMDHIIQDFSFSCLATWYLYECGNYVPEMEKLLEKCPVAFEKNDTPESIRSKIQSFFYTEYLLCHGNN